jgi:hypothetical protein
VFGKNLFCSNSKIGEVIQSGGSACFTGCYITPSTSVYAVVHGSNDGGATVGEHLKFIGCILTNNSNTEYGFIWFQNRDAVECLEFESCDFHNISVPLTPSRHTVRFTNCRFYIASDLFALMNSNATKLTIEQCTAFYENGATKLTYVLDVNSDTCPTGSPLIVYRNNHISKYVSFIYSTPTDGAGRIIGYDNFVEDTDCFANFGSIVNAPNENYVVHEHDNISV